MRGETPNVGKPIVVVRDDPRFAKIIELWENKLKAVYHIQSEVVEDEYLLREITIPDKHELVRWQQKLINSLYNYRRKLIIRCRGLNERDIPLAEIKFVEDEFTPRVFARGVDPEAALRVAVSQKVISLDDLTPLARVCIAINPWNRDLDVLLDGIHNRTGELLKYKLKRRRDVRHCKSITYEITNDGELRRLITPSRTTHYVINSQYLSKYFVLSKLASHNDLEIGSSKWNKELLNSFISQPCIISDISMREIHYDEIATNAQQMVDEIESELRRGSEDEKWLII